jgi:hypothetical protein
MDTLGFGCILPTAGRIGDFHPLERVPTGHTKRTPSASLLTKGVVTRYHLHLSLSEAFRPPIR